MAQRYGLWSAVPLAEIIDQALARYDQRLHSELPRIQQLGREALEAQDPPTPALGEVGRVFDLLVASLSEHAPKEAHVVFPLVRELERDGPRARLPVATLEPAIRVLTREHDCLAAALFRLRRLTGDYTAPASWGESGHALYHGLDAFDRGLSDHLRLEDDVLFPRVLHLERRLLRSRVSVGGIGPGGRRDEAQRGGRGH
jgi:regulator of cell morphogenesis and NO signaling